MGNVADLQKLPNLKQSQAEYTDGYTALSHTIAALR